MVIAMIRKLNETMSHAMWGHPRWTGHGGKTLSIKQELHLEKRGEESKNKSTSRPTVLGCGTDEENRRKPFCTTICHLQARPRVSSPEPPHLLQTADGGPRGDASPKRRARNKVASEHVALESSHAFRSYANSVATQ